MQYHVRWLHYTETDIIIRLSEKVYSSTKNSYGPNLGPTSSIFKMFLVSQNVEGADYRKVAGVFDKHWNLVMTVGVRQIYNTPSWLLSWMISNCKTAAFMTAFKEALNFICDYFEKKGCNEFFVVHPTEKEKMYRHIIKFMRERYWTFVEMTLPKHTKAEYSFYWGLMGYQLYPYDINIRRYILKRPQND